MGVGTSYLVPTAELLLVLGIDVGGLSATPQLRGCCHRFRPISASHTPETPYALAPDVSAETQAHLPWPRRYTDASG